MKTDMVQSTSECEVDEIVEERWADGDGEGRFQVTEGAGMLNVGL